MTGGITNTPKLAHLTCFDRIPLSAVSAIGALIAADEGGWVLSSDAEGADGGWTFGGMTATKYHEYDPSVTKEQLAKWLSDVTDKTPIIMVKQIIYGIYYDDFYQEASRLLTPILPQAYHLSCIINCGPEGFKEVLSKCGNVENQAIARTKFLAAWKERYFKIVRDNPVKAVYIHGWINRVWKYI